MGYKDVIKVFNDTGDCEIDICLLYKLWDDKWFISQWENKYRLCRRYYKSVSIKVGISEIQALEIINKKSMHNQKSPFKSGSTWITNPRP